MKGCRKACHAWNVLSASVGALISVLEGSEIQRKWQTPFTELWQSAWMLLASP